MRPGARSSKPRIVYWQNIPSPYMVGRFNVLADRGNLDFEAWFNEEREPDRSWEVDSSLWRFSARYIPTRTFFGRQLHLPFPEIEETRPDLFISLYDRTSFALGSIAARALARRTAYRVLPNYDSWSTRSWATELGKHILFQAVDGAKVPGPDGARLAGRYGLPITRTCPVTQSIDVAHYGQALLVDPAVRRQRRADLDLHGCVFLYCGRLWAGKGLDYLFDAYRQVCALRSDVSLLLVGDGVDEAHYRAEAKELPGIVFAGFVQPRDLPAYSALADVMVFPTLGDPHGLVVAEAMAAGLPVICTMAAGDIRRRLPDGEAGYLVPPADAASLADRMLRLANDPELRRRFGHEAHVLVESQTHERYACDFEEFVEHVLSAPPRRSAAALATRLAGRALLASSHRAPSQPAPLISSFGINTKQERAV